MNELDCGEFAKAIKALAKLHNRDFDPDSMAIYFRALEPYTWAEVSAAMAAHERDPQEGRFFPMPAHIIGHIRSKNKRMGADEAWSLIPLTEQESAYWTQEARQAFFQAALPLLEDGDKISARMAFKSAYERICRESDETNAPIRWEFSEGFDISGREQCLRRAIDRGLLEYKQACKLLPTFDQSVNDAQMIDIQNIAQKLLSKD